MGRGESRQRWDDDEHYYSSGSHSDDSPMLSYRYETHKPTERRRTACTALGKFTFCFAMLMFCVLLYIPVYNRANYQLPKGSVEGWSTHTNRDTKIYVLPNNVTTLHEPASLCNEDMRKERNKLFLLIVVCSATNNFEIREAIRRTWGDYEKYRRTSKLYNDVREKYKSYNYSYDLFPSADDIKSNKVHNNSKLPKNYSDYVDNKVVDVDLNSIDKANYDDASKHKRFRRDISSFNNLLPELAKALQSNLKNIKTDEVPETEEMRSDDDVAVLPEFDMNKELGYQADKNYDYTNYDDSNVMKIPPNGEEDSPDLTKILTLLKQSSYFPASEEAKESGNTDAEFKLVFLLGLPPHENDTETQNKIEKEVGLYGDVIQEGFVDSYNNLTLKSIMMLKWVTNKCNESVHYILKTDDDMYINVPHLVATLRNRSREAASKRGPELLLIGDLITGARPVLDARDKWYSPRYMYGGRVYPRYLSGTGYALSAAAATALYRSALRTPLFHLEDVYITGMCSVRATPRVVPRDDPAFSYRGTAPRGRAPAACHAHAHATAHRVPPDDMAAIVAALQKKEVVDRCERMRLTQIKQSRSWKSSIISNLFSSYG